MKSLAEMRAGLCVLIAIICLAGCGASEGSGADDGPSGNVGGGQSAATGCLTPGEVEAEVSRIAEGIETSSEEVEAKQREIAAVRAQGC